MLRLVGAAVGAIIIAGWAAYVYFDAPKRIEAPAAYREFIPQNTIDELKELGVTQAALANFFKILERERVPPEELDRELREIADHYRELEERLASFSSDDPVAAALKEEAHKALRAGELDRADSRLEEALIEAAASAARLGAQKATELDYAEAARYYQEAARLVPASEHALGAEYLGWQGYLWFLAGRYV